MALILAQLKYTRMYAHKPYDWQRGFHNAGKENSERLLMAANGVGKTLTGGYESAVHLTGDYPDWWQGRKYDRPVKMWVGSISNQAQKEYTQAILLGDDLAENLGTGMVPKERIIGKPRLRQAGVSDVCDTFQVRHKSGGVSTCAFKTYEQGWRLWQGAAPDIVWGDEQMDENALNEKRIFTEIQTRVFRSAGIMYFTLTPLLGETEFIRHFMYPKAEGIYWLGATWDNAPHLDENEKERLKKTYPAWELEARTKGVPMMGEGRIFTVPEDEITCEPFEIPNHYFRICGIDFGINHPFAAAWLAWDRHRDVVYVHDTLRVKGQDALHHSHAIRRRGDWIPTAWPHDGEIREKGSGDQLKKQYADHGVKMLSLSARYKNDKGGGQSAEPIIKEMNERMTSGGFYVFKNQLEWFEEYRSYHWVQTSDGRAKIAPIRDDLMKATQYGLMMKRYALQKMTPRRVVSSGASIRI